MKITLDEESVENIVKYAKSHPEEIKELMEVVGEQALEVLTERHVLQEGAKLYRAIQREINYTYRESD
ncbi:MAG: hypothetical protein R6U10_01750 [Thermoplasmatota archaeon]|jgi:hypothetical protein